MQRVLVVFPTQWDERHLTGPTRPRAAEIEVVLAEPRDGDCPDDLDARAYVDALVRAERGRIHGVLSSSDYPGATIAAVIATALALPGPAPVAVLRAAHKYHSRLAQRAAAPEATPPFALVDPRRRDGGPPDIAFPCFVKPVKGSFSALARRIDSQAELEAYLADPRAADWVERYLRIFHQLLEQHGRFEHDGRWFLAEGLLTGTLVTVEGFATRAGVTVIGVVDATVDPASGSFLRFDYPSRLPTEVQERMAELTRRVVARLELVDTLFNVELMHDPRTGALHLVEVNPRLCGQFADLYAHVDGVHGYELALDLATGRTPVLRRRAGPCGAAASVPLRVFRPVRVVRAPTPAEIAAVEAEFPGTLVWNECAPGQVLHDVAGFEDGASIRYAVVNTAAADRAALDARIAAIRARLPYEFAAL